jgi:hypothetical protein
LLAAVAADLAWIHRRAFVGDMNWRAGLVDVVMHVEVAGRAG